MASHVPAAQVVCRYTRPLALFAAIRAGRGIGFMPVAYAATEPDIVQLAPVEPGFGFDIWLLTHPDLTHAGRVRALLQHASAFFDARRDRCSGTRRPRRDPPYKGSAE